MEDLKECLKSILKNNKSVVTVCYKEFYIIFLRDSLTYRKLVKLLRGTAVCRIERFKYKRERFTEVSLENDAGFA